MELIDHYMQDDVKRQQLNQLTQKVFGFDFESWYINGYYSEDYIPYSLVEAGQMIANVSCNRMIFQQNGLVRHYIQIGTVMTDPCYRRQGLGTLLLSHVIQQYQQQCDGIYLFANLSALDFYRQAGFQLGLQYQAVLKSPVPAKKGLKPIDAQLGPKYRSYVKHSAVNAALEQLNKYSLQMFYTANLAHVYYDSDLDCFLVMDQDQDTLVIKSLISPHPLSLKTVLSHIDIPYQQLQLGFSPCQKDAWMFKMVPFDGQDDYRLLYLGKTLASIEREQLFFPLFSHA